MDVDIFIKRIYFLFVYKYIGMYRLFGLGYALLLQFDFDMSENPIWIFFLFHWKLVGIFVSISFFRWCAFDQNSLQTKQQEINEWKTNYQWKKCMPEIMCFI